MDLIPNCHESSYFVSLINVEYVNGDIVGEAMINACQLDYMSSYLSLYIFNISKLYIEPF